MKNTEKIKFPSDARGRLAGSVFLALIPLTVLVPVTPVPAWLVQDLVLRWTAFLAFLVCLSIFLFRPKGDYSLKLDFVDLVGLALAGWVLLSVKNSKEAFESFYAFRSFMAMVFWWFALRILWGRWPGLYPFFEKMLFAVTFAASAWLALSTLGHDLLPSLHDRLVPRIGLFVNENIAAGFIGMVLIWGVLKRLHGGTVPGWWLGTLLLGWCLTQSRGAFLAMGIVVILYCVIHMKEIEGRLGSWNGRQWIGAGLVVLAVAAVLSPMVNRLFNALDTDPDAYKRIDLWVSALKMLTAQPWFGFGPGTFKDVYPAFQPSSLWDKSVSFTHDEYLQVAVECGIPAMLLTLTFVGAVFLGIGRDLRRTAVFKANAPALEAAEAAFFLLLFEALQNMVDFTFHEWSHRLMLFGFVTYALQRKSGPEVMQAAVRFSRRAYFAAWGLLVFFLFWTLGLGSYRDFQSRILHFRALGALSQGKVDLAESLCRRSIGYRASNMIPWNYLGAIEEARGGWAKDPRQREAHFRAADSYFRHAIELSPYSLDPMENEVSDLTKRNKLSQALDLQAQLLQRVPNFAPGYIRLGRLQMKMGKYPNALLSASAALEVSPYLLEGQMLKADALAALGRPAEALEVYRKLQGWYLSPKASAEIADRIRRLEAHSSDAVKP